MTTSPDPTIKDFESALSELESLVKRLEDGKLTLEQSLELFERGVALSRYCHSTLADAEHRVEVLNDQGDLEPAPVDVASPHGDDQGTGS